MLPRPQGSASGSTKLGQNLTRETKPQSACLNSALFFLVYFYTFPTCTSATVCRNTVITNQLAFKLHEGRSFGPSQHCVVLVLAKGNPTAGVSVRTTASERPTVSERTTGVKTPQSVNTPLE